MREQGVVSSQIFRQRGEMLLLHAECVWRGSRPCFRVPGWADMIEPLKAARACHQRLCDDHELLHSGSADRFEKPHMRHHFPDFVFELLVVHLLLLIAICAHSGWQEKPSPCSERLPPRAPASLRVTKQWQSY